MIGERFRGGTIGIVPRRFKPGDGGDIGSGCYKTTKRNFFFKSKGWRE